MYEIARRIAQVRQTFLGISKDVEEFLTMAELSVPVVENVVEKMKARIAEVERLFEREEKR